MSARILLTALSLALATTAPAWAQDPPILTGHVHLAGDTAGYVRVRIPHDIPDPKAGEGNVDSTFHGDAVFLGYVLRSDFPINGFHGTAGGFFLASSDGRIGGGGYAGALPAGVYRLYLLTSGGHAEADLTINGLDGSSSLTPDTPIPVDAGPMTRRPSADGRVVIGRTVTQQSDGLMIFRADWHLATGQVAQVERCDYPGGDGGRPDAYDAGCPGAPTHNSLDTPTTGGDTTGDNVTSYQRSGFGPGDTFGIGLNVRWLNGTEPPVSGYAAAFSLMPSADTIQLPPTPPPGPSPTPQPPPAADTVTFVSNTVQAIAHQVLVPLHCAGPSACEGKARVGGAQSVAFRVPAGASRVVKVPLSRSQSAVLARRGSLRASVQLYGKGVRDTRRTLTIRSRRAG
jgi:hypothetical protein